MFGFTLLIKQDLNRIKKKPYTETVDSDGRSDEVSKDFIIFFLFSICATCVF